VLPEPGDNQREADDTEELDMDSHADVWLDTEDLYEDLTDQEAEEGRAMGKWIDTADDRDSGG
jgi:hypothetical protein